MANLFHDGAELQDTLFWDVVYDVVTIDTVVFRSGLASYSISESVPTVSKTFPAKTEAYFQFAFYFGGLVPNPGNFLDFKSDTTVQLGVRVNTGLLRAYVGTTQVGVGTHSILANTWYCIEVHIKIADVGGIFQVKVDGNMDIDFSGDTKSAAIVDMNNIFIKSFTGCVLRIDDISANDISGGVDNSWIGDEHYEKIYPIGNGAHNNWHGSDGDDLNNWNLVDEFPNDGDTTYVYRAGADSGNQDQYDMSMGYDGTNKVIARVWSECRARKTSATGHQLKVGLLPSGGVDQLSPARDLYVNNYRAVVGSDYLVNPVDGLVWEEADIDALEYINEVA